MTDGQEQQLYRLMWTKIRSNRFGRWGTGKFTLEEAKILAQELNKRHEDWMFIYYEPIIEKEQQP